MVAEGEIIDEEMAKKIEEAGVAEVISPLSLTCQSRYGMCAKCYGWDLGTKSMVEIGTPVGVIAAQSIGEPGTQLTLKTKHAAGVVGWLMLPKDFQELKSFLNPEFPRLFRL